MKTTTYKTISIIPFFVGAVALVHGAGYTGGAKRANVPAESIPPPVVAQSVQPASSQAVMITTVPAPAPQEVVSIETTIPVQATSTLNVETLTTLGPSGSLGGAEFVQSIKDANAENRARIAADIDVRLSANSGALTSLRSHSSELSAVQRAKLQEAEANLKAKETALKATLDNTRRATVGAWSGSTLAADYEAYARAVKEYEAMFPTSAFITQAKLPSATIAVSADATAAADGKTYDADGNESAPSHEGAPADRNFSDANRSAMEPQPQAGPNSAPAELQ